MTEVKRPMNIPLKTGVTVHVNLSFPVHHLHKTVHNVT
uniref:Uncharacterized protein n=1 Tax=Anguilla anguilla TaxID=7936 RepID=A0A0E9RV58_ANGAN